MTLGQFVVFLHYYLPLLAVTIIVRWLFGIFTR